MTTDRTTHDWKAFPSKTRGEWIHIPGRPVAMVRTQEMPQGYLWQHGKQVGFAKTLAEAKDWVETAREFWPRHLPT